jgi:hypothetical protein
LLLLLIHNKWSGPDPVQNGQNAHQCQGTAIRSFSDKSVEFFFKEIITLFFNEILARFPARVRFATAFYIYINKLLQMIFLSVSKGEQLFSTH